MIFFPARPDVMHEGVCVVSGDVGIAGAVKRPIKQHVRTCWLDTALYALQIILQVTYGTVQPNKVSVIKQRMRIQGRVRMGKIG